MLYAGKGTPPCNQALWWECIYRMLRPYLQYLFGRCWNRIAVSCATPLGHLSAAEKLRYLCSSRELCWLLAPGTTPRKQPATSTGFSSPGVWQVQTRGITHKYHMADNTWQLQCREKTLKASAGVFIQCTSYYSSHTFYKYIWKKLAVVLTATIKKSFLAHNSN